MGDVNYYDLVNSVDALFTPVRRGMPVGPTGGCPDIGPP
jgi:hypothetical protein